MRYLKCFIFLFFLSATIHGDGQVSFTPQIPPTGIMLKSQLWNCFLVSTNPSPVSVSISLTLLNTADNTPVLSATSRYITLAKGSKQISINNVAPVQYNYLSSVMNVDRNPNGLLPIGNFQACYTVNIGNYEMSSKLDGGCIPVEVSPLSPPMLNMPLDRDTLATPYPDFSWLPPSPINLFTNLSYDLVLVEVLPNQSTGGAIQKNIPVFSESNGRKLSLSYPASNKMLDTTKLYAWRVIAKNSGQFVGQSDVWSFVVKSGKKNMASLTTPNSGYIRLKRVNELTYAYCLGLLKFEYINESGDSSIDYTIRSLDRRSNEVLFNGKLKIRNGQNFIDLHIESLKSIRSKGNYLLQFKNRRNEDWGIRFYYRKYGEKE